jgi:carboxymethylenebutenolidase
MLNMGKPLDMSNINIHTASGDFALPYLSAGAGEPIILLFPAIAGANPYMQAVANRLHQCGYGILTLDYYARNGTMPDISTPEKIGAAVSALSDRQVLSDARAAINALRAQPGGNQARIGTLGFCIGGMYSLLTACEELGIAAAVDYYGAVRYAQVTAEKPHSCLDRAANLRAPLLAHFGTFDRLISAADIEELERVLQGAGRHYELYRYGGAPHAFDEDHRAAVFRPAAAQLAWARTTAFLDWHLRSVAPR